MLSILPEPDNDGFLIDWAQELRDTNESWMRLAQRGVEAFVVQAMGEGVPFAMETVFSHWEQQADGTHASKIDRIRELQDAGYFVLLCFVGLANVQVSLGRVLTRVAEGGHSVPEPKLINRFPRTQSAIAAALSVVDAAILVDNSLTKERAFDPCRIEVDKEVVYDLRQGGAADPAILEWLDIVSPVA
jgi:predicted ABC-type ATPase